MSFDLVRLADCCDIVAGATPSTNVDSYWGGGIAWATPKDLSDLDGKYLSSTPDTLSEEGYRSCSAKLMPAGSVLFSSRAPIGHVAINSIPMCTNQGFKSFVPDASRVSADYLYHWLRANKAYLQSLGNGATFKEVSKAVVAEIRIPLPPLLEQRRIAAILDKADALRAKRTEAIAKLDQLLQSVFREMFGDPVTNSKGWNQSRLGSICDVGSSNRVFVEELVEKGVPFYRGTEIGLLGEGKPVAPTLFITEKHYERLKSQSGVPAKGDLLLPSICQDGRIHLVTDDKPFYFKDGRVLWIKTSGSSLNSIYLRFHLREVFCSNYSRIASGTTFAELKIFALKALMIQVPPRREQNRFGEIVESMYELRTRQIAHFDQLRSLFSSLQQRAFSGRLSEAA